MARSRNIKPSFFTNDTLAECSPLARLLFIGLWTIADREGKMEDRLKKIKAEVLPYDDCDIESLVQELCKHGFITRYERDGHRAILVLKFLKHQNPHVKEPPSAIPYPHNYDEKHMVMLSTDIAPDKNKTRTVQEQEMHQPFPADSLNLIPDSPSPHPQADDDDRRRAELEKQAQEAEAERNAKLLQPMTAEWKPDLKILGDHLNMLMAQAMVNGVKTTPEMLTEEILCSYRHSGFTSQKRRSLHEWHGGLAKYLVSCLKNPKKPESKQSQQQEQPIPRKYPVFKPMPDYELTEEDRAKAAEGIKNLRAIL